ncbi:uncharacterized protein LOC112559563 [Pomacea canaliculata]|uniref:uncharacterized protein LOC112559563 n=1 Tax=Pomacea canaliculata TaxID=400727 RepID=UPI000D73BCA7|nr:uncharacterized protein LOC112559563 [Pomacea canaliculata]
MYKIYFQKWRHLVTHSERQCLRTVSRLDAVTPWCSTSKQRAGTTLNPAHSPSLYRTGSGTGSTTRTSFSSRSLRWLATICKWDRWNTIISLVQRHRGNTYIIKADAVVKTVQPYLDLYFCWQLTQTSPGAFQVYELTAAEKSGLVAGVRVYTRRAGDPTPDFSAVCSLRSSDETPTYLFEVTSSNATDVDVTSVSAQSCPDAVVAKFSYVHNGAECRDKTSDIDFCVEQTARVNHDLCSAEILFSVGGVLKCIATFSVQGSPVVLLMNTDSSVNDSTSRFACMKLDKVGDITLSTVSEDCKINGSSHTLELTRTGGCTESKDNVPLIVGLVVGIAVLAAGVAAGVVCYKRVSKEEEGEIRHSSAACRH